MLVTSKNLTPYSRRAFLKRILIVAAAATATTMAAGKLLRLDTQSSRLPGPGSIFEPRRQDLARHWREKLRHFRLR